MVCTICQTCVCAQNLQILCGSFAEFRLFRSSCCKLSGCSVKISWFTNERPRFRPGMEVASYSSTWTRNTFPSSNCPEFAIRLERPVIWRTRSSVGCGDSSRKPATLPSKSPEFSQPCELQPSPASLLPTNKQTNNQLAFQLAKKKK